jgi:hypothetical protein
MELKEQIRDLVWDFEQGCLNAFEFIQKVKEISNIVDE